MDGAIGFFYFLASVLFCCSLFFMTKPQYGQKGMPISIVCAMVSGMFFGWAVWLTVKELGV